MMRSLSRVIIGWRRGDRLETTQEEKSLELDWLKWEWSKRGLGLRPFFWANAGAIAWDKEYRGWGKKEKKRKGRFPGGDCNLILDMLSLRHPWGIQVKSCSTAI